MRIKLLAGICFGAALLSLAFGEHLDDLERGLRETTALLNNAVHQTKENLAFKIGEVTQDARIAEHLSWNLSHSLKSALESHISMGQIDRISLWTQGAVEVVRARDADDTPPFEPGSAQEKVERYHWHKSPKGIELSLLRTLLGGSQKIYLWGSVKLNDTWLSRFPRLRDALREQHLILSPLTEKSNLLPEAFQSEGPQLYSEDHSNLLLTKHMTIFKKIAKISFFTLFFSALICILWDLRYLHLTIRKTKKEIETFATWVLQTTDRKDQNKLIPPSLRSTKHLLQDFFHEKDRLIKDLTHELTHTKNLLTEREQKIMKHIDLTTTLSSYQSLGIEMMHLVLPFQKELQKIASISEKLEDLLLQKISKPAESLHDLMVKWSQDIALRGSRKFIRSLAETEGSSPPKTVLDEELDRIRYWAMEVLDLSQDSKPLIDYLYKTTSALEKIGIKWSECRHRSTLNLPATSPWEPLLQAQDLILWDTNDRGVHVNFVNLRQESVPFTLPSASYHIWVSSFFHFISTIFSTKEPGTYMLTCRMRSYKEKCLLIMELNDPKIQQAQDDTTKEKFKSTIDLIKFFLARFNGLVQILPPRGPIRTFIIQWDGSQDENTAVGTHEKFPDTKKSDVLGDRHSRILDMSQSVELGQV